MTPFQELETAAKDQGWSIEKGPGRVARFRNPSTARFVTVNLTIDGPTDFAQTLRRLKDAGFRWSPRAGKRKHTEEETMAIHSNGKVDVQHLAVPAGRDDTVGLAQDEAPPTADDFAVLLGMVEELADQFRLFRDHVQEVEVETLGKLRILTRVEALAEAFGPRILALEDGFLRAAERIEAIESRPAEKIDPLEKFRERLR